MLRTIGHDDTLSADGPRRARDPVMPTYLGTAVSAGQMPLSSHRLSLCQEVGMSGISAGVRRHRRCPDGNVPRVSSVPICGVRSGRSIPWAVGHIGRHRGPAHRGWVVLRRHGRRIQLPGPSSNDRSPVNLATPVNMADGMAHQSAIVRLGRRPHRGAQPDPSSSRVLAFGQLREQLRPSMPSTRQMPVPAYSTQVSGAGSLYGPTRPRSATGSAPDPSALPNTTLRSRPSVAR